MNIEQFDSERIGDLSIGLTDKGRTELNFYDLLEQKYFFIYFCYKSLFWYENDKFEKTIRILGDRCATTEEMILNLGKTLHTFLKAKRRNPLWFILKAIWYKLSYEIKELLNEILYQWKHIGTTKEHTNKIRCLILLFKFNIAKPILKKFNITLKFHHEYNIDALLQVYAKSLSDKNHPYLNIPESIIYLIKKGLHLK